MEQGETNSNGVMDWPHAPKACIKCNQACSCLEPAREGDQNRLGADVPTKRYEWAVLKKSPQDCVRWKGVVAVVCSPGNQEALVK